MGDVLLLDEVVEALKRRSDRGRDDLDGLGTRAVGVCLGQKGEVAKRVEEPRSEGKYSFKRQAILAHCARLDSGRNGTYIEEYIAFIVSHPLQKGS